MILCVTVHILKGLSEIIENKIQCIVLLILYLIYVSTTLFEFSVLLSLIKE